MLEEIRAQDKLLRDLGAELRNRGAELRDLSAELRNRGALLRNRGAALREAKEQLACGGGGGGGPSGVSTGSSKSGSSQPSPAAGGQASPFGAARLRAAFAAALPPALAMPWAQTRAPCPLRCRPRCWCTACAPPRACRTLTMCP